ncbi:unnamed protein product [Clavelina lepadiformis]|uniref:Taste receptor type 2 n=1 Tax=Clavelina lepadiformis TaxID=159417 RepID=A0ABP0GD19_CLALP
MPGSLTKMNATIAAEILSFGTEVEATKFPYLVAFLFVTMAIEVTMFSFLLKISCSRDNGQPCRRAPSPVKVSPLMKIFLFCVFTMIVYSTMLLIRVFLPLTYSNEMCTLLLRVTGPTMYSICMMTIYTFVWARQYYIHASSVTRSFMPKWLRILSKTSIFFTIISFALPIVATWVKVNGYQFVEANYKNNKCYHRVESLIYLPPVLAVLTSTSQFIYVFIFYITIRIFIKKSSLSSTAISGMRKKKSSRFHKLVKRCLTVALLCGITDVITMVLVNTACKHIPEPYAYIFIKLDTTFNIFCMLFCFNSIPSSTKSRFLRQVSRILHLNDDENPSMHSASSGQQIMTPINQRKSPATVTLSQKENAKLPANQKAIFTTSLCQQRLLGMQTHEV